MASIQAVLRLISAVYQSTFSKFCIETL